MENDYMLDMPKLLALIEKRPSLWDRNLKSYTDKNQKKLHWEEVLTKLYDNFEDKTDEEKQILEDHVFKKWINVRDTYLRNVKQRQVGKRKSLYKYEDNLHFLKKFLPSDSPEYKAWECESNEIKKEKNKSPKKDKNKGKKSVNEIEPVDEPKVKKHKKKKKHTDSEEYLDDEETHADEVNQSKTSKNNYHNNEEYYDEDYGNHSSFYDNSQRHVMNEDEAFFASLLPTVTKYTSEQRMEFRIQVLTLMKRLNSS